MSKYLQTTMVPNGPSSNFVQVLSLESSHQPGVMLGQRDEVQSDGLEALGRALARENLHAVGMSSFEDFWATSG